MIKIGEGDELLAVPERIDQFFDHLVCALMPAVCFFLTSQDFSDIAQFFKENAHIGCDIRSFHADVVDENRNIVISGLITIVELWQAVFIIIPASHVPVGHLSVAFVQVGERFLRHFFPEVMQAHEPVECPALCRRMDTLAHVLSVKDEIRELATLTDVIDHIDQQIGCKFEVMIQSDCVLNHLPGGCQHALCHEQCRPFDQAGWRDHRGPFMPCSLDPDRLQFFRKVRDLRQEAFPVSRCCSKRFVIGRIGIADLAGSYGFFYRKQEFTTFIRRDASHYHSRAHLAIPRSPDIHIACQRIDQQGAAEPVDCLPRFVRTFLDNVFRTHCFFKLQAQTVLTFDVHQFVVCIADLDCAMRRYQTKLGHAELDRETDALAFPGRIQIQKIVPDHRRIAWHRAAAYDHDLASLISQGRTFCTSKIGKDPEISTSCFKCGSGSK